jgi:hypothetical protein
MNSYAYQELITEGIKGLPTELLREVADFVYLLRKRMQDPQGFAEEQSNFLLSAELHQLSRHEERHLEEEFAYYEQRFPRQ